MDFTFLSKLDYTGVGAWIVIIFYTIEKAIVPTFNRFLPMRSDLQKSVQARLDSELKFKHEIEARQVKAYEETAKATAEISKVLSITETRITSIEFTQRQQGVDIQDIKQAVLPRKPKKVA
jgi:hypothetical protein